jgi:hypothetical protein
MSSSAEDILQTKLDAALTGTDTIDIPLYDGGLPIGLMRPLTSRHLEAMDVIEKLTNWRNANMSKFLTQFEATPVRTRAWVENVVLRTPGQMLWLVYDQNDNLVGHFGFKKLTRDSVVLDNAMRGERQGHPKLFVVAGKRLVEWLWQTTPVQRIDAYVLADNVPSIMMNRQIGFLQCKRLPLIKRTTESDTHWEMGKEGNISPHGRYCFTLVLERSENSSATSQPSLLRNSRFTD